MKVYLSLGSNIDAETNLCSAIKCLKQHFPVLLLSPIYQTRAVGFEGDDFLNCVVALETETPATELFSLLRQIEQDHGRDRKQAKFSSRTLDIDLLTWGNKIITEKNFQLPRDEITKYAFVLKPLVDIAAEEKHPIFNKSYQQLWNELDLAKQPIKKMELDCENLA